MSVHGEFGRTLETLIACCRALPPDLREDWPARLESARVASHPDLSSAARYALETIDGLADIVPGSPPLAAAEAHLRSHCHIILGLPQDASS